MTVQNHFTKEQLEFLKNIQCDEVQGFYLSKPLSSTELENLLQEFSSK